MIARSLGMVVLVTLATVLLLGVRSDPTLRVDVAQAAPASAAAAEPPAVRPESYGARGGDARDDTAALQRAVDVAAHRGAVVRLSATTYVLSRGLRLPSRSTLVGAGPASVLKFTFKYNVGEQTGYYVGNRDQMTGNTELVLRDFSILGAGTGYPAGPNSIAPAPWVPGVRMRMVDGLTINKVHIRRAPGISMLLQGVTGAVIERNHIARSGRDGINVGWFQRPSTEVLVRHNHVTRVGDDGLAVVGYPMEWVSDAVAVSQVRLVDNQVIGWARNPNGKMLGRGIAVLGATQIQVVRNRVERTHSFGILVSGAGRPGLIDPATDLPWRSAQIRVRNNDVSDAGALSRGSAAIAQASGFGAVVCKTSDHVLVKRNRAHAAVGVPFASFECTDAGPQL